MTRSKLYIEMAGIWFGRAFGIRMGAVQKRECERLGWYYLMQAIMTDMHS